METRDNLTVEGTPSVRNAKTEGRFPHPGKGFFLLVVVVAGYRTGWTGVVTKLTQQSGEFSERKGKRIRPRARPALV